MKHHHVGCACKDIDKTAAKLENMFGASRGVTVFDPLQNAHLCILTMPDGTFIELVAGEVVATYLKKRIGYYHICYEVAGIEDAITRLSESGAVVVSPPKPAILFDNRQVAFLMTPMGLIELLEESITER